MEREIPAIAERFIEKARVACPRFAFPEAEAPLIAEVASNLAQLGVARPVLIGDADIIKSHGYDLSGCEIIDLATQEGQDKKAEVVSKVAPLLGFPEKIVSKKMKNNLDFAAAMVRSGDVDCACGGYTFTTAQTITATTMFIGVKPDVDYTSCFLVVEVPSYEGPAGEDRLFVITDTSSCFADTPEELAQIAINAAGGAERIMGWEPRVAMLSFSTHGSGKRDCADKVIAATNLVRERCPELKVDGEVQLDAALLPAIADKKCGEGNVLGGKANVLVFPNMDAANIGAKIFEIMAGGSLYGPWHQGYNGTMQQLSRSFSYREIFVSCVMTAAGAK